MPICLHKLIVGRWNPVSKHQTAGAQVQNVSGIIMGFREMLSIISAFIATVLSVWHSGDLCAWCPQACFRTGGGVIELLQTCPLITVFLVAFLSVVIMLVLSINTHYCDCVVSPVILSVRLITYWITAEYFLLLLSRLFKLKCQIRFYLTFFCCC